MCSPQRATQILRSLITAPAAVALAYWDTYSDFIRQTCAKRFASPFFFRRMVRILLVYRLPNLHGMTRFWLIFCFFCFHVLQSTFTELIMTYKPEHVPQSRLKDSLFNPADGELSILPITYLQRHHHRYFAAPGASKRRFFACNAHPKSFAGYRVGEGDRASAKKIIRVFVVSNHELSLLFPFF